MSGCGDDCYVGHCFIAGFAQAVYAGISDRFAMEWVSGDNTAGLYLNNTNDLARIHHVHWWNFVTYTYLTDSTNGWRSGTGFWFDTLAEGNSVEDCFCFGYKTGFNVQGASNVLTNCWADGPQAIPLSNSQSFLLGGNDLKLIGCQASSHQYGYYINSNGFVDMEGCSSWGAPSNCQFLLYVNAVGYLKLHGGMLWGNYANSTMPSIAFIGINATGIGWYSIDQVTFWGQGTGAALTAISVSGASAQVGNIGCNNIYTGAVSAPVASQDVRNATSGLFPNSHARYSFGGSAGLTDNMYQAANVPGNGQTSPSAVAIYKINTFGCVNGTFYPAAALRMQIDGSPGVGSMPGCVILSTTPSGATVGVDRVIVRNTGNLDPVTDNSVSLGDAGLRWSAVWAVNGTIQTSDARQKNVLGDAPGLEFINLLRPVTYQWKVGGKRVLRQKRYTVHRKYQLTHRKYRVVRQKWHTTELKFLHADGTEIAPGQPVPPDAVPKAVVTEIPEGQPIPANATCVDTVAEFMEGEQPVPPDATCIEESVTDIPEGEPVPPNATCVETTVEVPEGEPIPPDAIAGEIVTEDLPGKRVHWGLLAQDVKAAADKIGIDFGGWIKTDPTDPESEEGLRYDQLVASLIKAVQEQDKRIGELEALARRQ